MLARTHACIIFVFLSRPSNHWILLPTAPALLIFSQEKAERLFSIPGSEHLVRTYTVAWCNIQCIVFARSLPDLVTGHFCLSRLTFSKNNVVKPGLLATVILFVLLLEFLAPLLHLIQFFPAIRCGSPTNCDHERFSSAMASSCLRCLRLLWSAYNSFRRSDELVQLIVITRGSLPL